MNEEISDNLDEISVQLSALADVISEPLDAKQRAYYYGLVLGLASRLDDLSDYVRNKATHDKNGRAFWETTL